MKCRHWLLSLMPAFLLSAAMPAFADDATPSVQLQENVNYRVIPQQPVSTPNDEIEVIDFFWYGCPHCYRFQPALEAWRKQMPADVVFRHIPAVFHDSWAQHARIFYTLDALGEVERLHQAVYVGYHVEQLRMRDPDVMVDWAVKHSIDKDKWTAAYNSQAVIEKTAESTLLTQNYDIEGTPSLVVDGRYVTSGGMVDKVEDMIPVLNALIAKVRAEREATRKDNNAKMPASAPTP